MFPPRQLTLMLQQTNLQLRKQHAQEVSKSELLKFFGLLILTTRFQFQSRRDLWNTNWLDPFNKYVPSPQFGRTGMSRHRFDTIWNCLRFSQQPDVRPAGMSSEAYRWRLVEDFVNHINQHRADMFQPSDLICVDESMSRWYGKGGH